MLKPVSILALDEAAQSLAEAVRLRIAATFGLDDLVQVRSIAADTDLAGTIESIHARRQAPDSPLRMREDIANRELVLLMLSASGARRSSNALIDLAPRVRQVYDMRGMAQYYVIEVLYLLPDLFASTAADYGAAYSLLKNASGAMTEEPPPFNAMWLLASTNASRMKFGTLEQGRDAYVEMIAGALTFEPELSGTLPGAFRPRGMDATFSSFGFAELLFPRDVALRRIESRLSAELLREKLLATAATPSAALPQLAAKQLVASDEFAAPLSRIGIDAGQSLFRRFQPRTLVSEKTRNAEEVIAAVQAELKVYRDGPHVQNLQTLTAQGEETSKALAALVKRVVEETLDREDYASAIRLLEALLDPLPDLNSQMDVAPRNLVTEITTATAALDARVRFLPNAAVSDATRKRVREVDSLLADQKLVADVLSIEDNNTAKMLAAMQHEKSELARQLPEILFREETENSAARNAARDAEQSRLAEERATKEQQLRELFEQRPRAEQALREWLEERVAFIRRQVAWGVFYAVLSYAVPLAVSRAWLFANFGRVTFAVLVALSTFAIYGIVRYSITIAPGLRAAREYLQRLHEQIDATDKAKNAACNDELQFEYDVAHRRTTLSVLRRTREVAKTMLEVLRERTRALRALADSFDACSRAATIPATRGVSVAIVDDADVDGWYERTAGDRKLRFLEFFELCMKRSQSLHLPLAELQTRIAEYAARAFDDFRKVTIADAAKIGPPAATARRLRRFAESSAPLIEVRDDDMPAQQAMQRDMTLWLDPNDAAFVETVRRRMPDAHLRPPTDPLRVHALSRVLHYPAYVLAQIEYYRAQYVPSEHPESADVPDLLPAELVLTGPIRTVYEQILLGRAVGVIRLRKDGQLSRASNDAVLGDTNLAAAQCVVASAMLRQELDRELLDSPDIERDLREFLATPLSVFDRNVVAVLLKRYGSEF
jgi:hypothetical protein